MKLLLTIIFFLISSSSLVKAQSKIYKVYVLPNELKRGVGPEMTLKITKKGTGGDILTFRGTMHGQRAWYSYYSYGTEEEKGEVKLRNGITTRHTIILAKKDTDSYNHFLHKYYLNGQLVLIRDENTGRDIFVPFVLHESMMNLYDK